MGKTEKKKEKNTIAKEAKSPASMGYLKVRAATLQQELANRQMRLDDMKKAVKVEGEAILRLRGGITELLQAIEQKRKGEKL